MKKLIAFFSFILLIILFLYVGVEITKEKIPELEVQGAKISKLSIHFLDIGQGDATFIEFPNGEQMLIDCAIDARILESLGKVMPYYDKSLDYLLITHPDKDHYGGCIDVLNRFEVKTIILTGFQKEGSFFESFENAVATEGAHIQKIGELQQWTIASTSVKFLYPTRDLAMEPNVPNQEKETGANDASIVMLLEYEGKKVLFTGDAEEALEEYLVQQYGEKLQADVYKASHHGSPGSSIQPFVELIQPKHTIYSAGIDNSYGHPSLRVIRRMQRLGAEQWRTDQQGDILITIDSNGLNVESEY